jgi:hypothetical protein
MENSPPIILNIWDSDKGGLNPLDGDDYLGRACIPMQNAAISNDDTIMEPKWHDIKLGFHDREPATGAVLCSFSVVEADYAFRIPINYLDLTEEIPYKNFQVDINVLGLR